MSAYIFKSSLSLIILFGLYWFLLRKEKLFTFNRFFLVLSVVFSLAVPFISIPVNFQSIPKLENIIHTYDYIIPEISISENIISRDMNFSQPNIEEQPSAIDISSILPIIYISGVILFLIRFLSNIYLIIHRIKVSENIRFEGYRILLIDDKTGPYCFFSSIFINRDDYLTERIDKELFNHELEHIRQYHSIDIIFIELIKIIYWFNPIHLLYDRAIRINHEYLADHAVIRDDCDIKSYMDTLLSFIIGRRNIPLTSGSNHSFTKKRLLMMTKSKSKGLIYGIKIAVTLCMIVVFLFLLAFKQSNTEPITSMSSFEAPIMIQKEVNGFVVNEFGKYLQGVNITITGTSRSVTTDAMGRFSIDNVPEDASLVYSSKDYKTLILKPGLSSDVIVKLLLIPEYDEKIKAHIDTSLMPKYKPLIVIDGVVDEKVFISEIDPDKVISMNVLRDKNAADKYGEKGINRVIETASKNIFSKTDNQQNNIKSTNTSSYYKPLTDPLVVINGTITSKSVKDIDINVTDIESLTVIKHKSATTKYGEKSRNGVIEIITKKETVESIENESAETNISNQQKIGITAKPVKQDEGKDAVVASINMNVLYRGIANPVEIAVPGITSDKITATTTNGKIKKINNRWEVIPGDQSESIITILVNNEKVSEKIFKIKNIPDPVAVFAGVNNGSTSKDIALKTEAVEAELEDFDLDLKFKIESFKLLSKKENVDLELSSKGNKLTDSMRLIIADLKKGQYIIIKDIKAIGPDGRLRDLNPMILKIK